MMVYKPGTVTSYGHQLVIGTGTTWKTGKIDVIGKIIKIVSKDKLEEGQKDEPDRNHS